MTRKQDIEGVMDRWFTEGPTRMPDRLFDAVVDRIERVPQRRFTRLRMRLASLHVDPRYAAAAAMVVAAAGLGAALVLTRPSSVGTTPTTSPSAESGSTPAALLGLWVPLGPPTLPSKFGASSITISPTDLEMHVDSQRFQSASSFIQPSRLDLVFGSTSDYLGCQAGARGTYTFTVSPVGVLTLNRTSDACAARGDVLGGSWTRMDRSALTPGQYVGSRFRPFGGGTSGEFSFTVPVGWTDHWETSDYFRTEREQSLIQMYLNVEPSSLDAACATTGSRVAGTPAAIAGWLKALPGLVTSTATPVTIGGLSGVMVDVSVATGWTSPCSTGGRYQMFVGAYSASPVGMDSGGRARYLLLDRGDGGSLLIVVETSDTTTWDALVAEAMPIVDSFRFTP